VLKKKVKGNVKINVKLNHDLTENKLIDSLENQVGFLKSELQRERENSSGLLKALLNQQEQVKHLEQEKLLLINHRKTSNYLSEQKNGLMTFLNKIFQNKMLS